MTATKLSLSEFVGFTLNTMRGCLRANEREIALRPKSFDLLATWLKIAAHLRWRIVLVRDGTIGRCVSDMRRGFDDRRARSPDSPMAWMPGCDASEQLNTALGAYID